MCVSSDIAWLAICLRFVCMYGCSVVVVVVVVEKRNAVFCVCVCIVLYCIVLYS